MLTQLVRNRGSDMYTYVMMVRLRRSESMLSAYFFRHGAAGGTQLIGLQLFVDNPGHLDSTDQMRNGRQLSTCTDTQSSPRTQFANLGWLTYGKWHQIGTVLRLNSCSDLPARFTPALCVHISDRGRRQPHWPVY